MSDEEKDDLLKMINDALKAREQARKEPQAQMPPAKEPPPLPAKQQAKQPPVRQQSNPHEQQPERRQDHQQQQPPHQPVNRDVGQAQQQPAPHRVQSGNHRFLNPYNFIRYLDAPRPDGKILGSCPPPPHDRYVGLSGRIVCSIETVSPLFVSDAHDMQPDSKRPEHTRYRFFKYDGKHAIPGSSLRGMFRNVYEAVTNSCLSVLDDRTLSYHFSSRSAPWLVPARVEKKGERWLLRLLPGSSNPQVEKQGVAGPGGMQYAAWVGRYWPIKPSKTLRGIDDPRYHMTPKQQELQHKFITRTKRLTRNPDGVKHGEECWALLRRFQHPHPRINFWDVVEVRRRCEDLPEPESDQETQQQGWLCVTNQNIEVKHSERFFFHRPQPGTGAIFAELTPTVRNAYEKLIADYQDRHAKSVADLRLAGNDPGRRWERRDAQGNTVGEPGFSRFVIDPAACQLRDGDLVYAFLAGNEQKPEVRFIAPVSVPRVAYKKSIGDLLLPYKQDLCRCTELERLCPACRLFGWVSEKATEDEEGRKQSIAYAGRLKFSHAELQGTAKVLGEIPLAILGSPKPTTTVFYLRPVVGFTEENARIWEEGYNGKVRIRGRKYYRHHEAAQEDEYKRKQGLGSDGKQHGNKDDQNRTVVDALDVGNSFRFALDFENVASAELGALLWVLHLEEGHYHRLGFAKPLGFGSVKVRVETLEILNPAIRYGFDHKSSTSPLASDTDILSTAPSDKLWTNCLTAFETAMKDAYGSEFVDLPNIADLRKLTGKPPLSAIHYPRPTVEQDSAGQNFQWFVENNRTQATILPYAADETDTNGLQPQGKTSRSGSI